MCHLYIHIQYHWLHSTYIYIYIYISAYENIRSFRKPPLLGPPLSLPEDWISKKQVLRLSKSHTTQPTYPYVVRTLGVKEFGASLSPAEFWHRTKTRIGSGRNPEFTRFSIQTFSYIGGGFIGEKTVGHSKFEQTNLSYIGEKTLQQSRSQRSSRQYSPHQYGYSGLPSGLPGCLPWVSGWALVYVIRLSSQHSPTRRSSVAKKNTNMDQGLHELLPRESGAAPWRGENNYPGVFVSFSWLSEAAKNQENRRKTQKTWSPR